jgi:hypothetical protein
MGVSDERRVVELMKLNKRGNFVAGVAVGAVVALTANFFMTHHVVVDKDKCKWSIEANGYMCKFHYERNK